MVEFLLKSECKKFRKGYLSVLKRIVIMLVIVIDVYYNEMSGDLFKVRRIGILEMFFF